MEEEVEDELWQEWEQQVYEERVANSREEQWIRGVSINDIINEVKNNG